MAILLAMLRTDHIQITQEMLRLIAEIDEFRGQWRATGRLAPERLRQLRRVATIESVGSSTRIEGAQLTDRQVEELLAHARRLTTRDEQEVAGYAQVIETILSSHEFIPLTESHIRQLHAQLLQYSDKDIRHRGEYKKVNNNIEAFDEHGRSLGIVFQTATPFDTPRLMQELVEWYSRAVNDNLLHPLIAIGIFKVVFLAIHPFQDGNGRLSRLLTTLLLLKAGYAFIPYGSLESIIEISKDSYYLSLRRTQGTLNQDAPDWTPWLTFFIRLVQQHKERLLAKIKREHIMLATKPELAVSILEIATQRGQISVGEAIRLTGAPRGTVKKHLANLVQSGHMKRTGQGRGTIYLPT